MKAFNMPGMATLGELTRKRVSAKNNEIPKKINAVSQNT